MMGGGEGEVLLQGRITGRKGVSALPGIANKRAGIEVQTGAGIVGTGEIRQMQKTALRQGRARAGITMTSTWTGEKAGAGAGAGSGQGDAMMSVKDTATGTVTT